MDNGRTKSQEKPNKKNKLICLINEQPDII